MNNIDFTESGIFQKKKTVKGSSSFRGRFSYFNLIDLSVLYKTITKITKKSFKEIFYNCYYNTNVKFHRCYYCGKSFKYSDSIWWKRCQEGDLCIDCKKQLSREYRRDLEDLPYHALYTNVKFHEQDIRSLIHSDIMRRIRLSY